MRCAAAVLAAMPRSSEAKYELCVDDSGGEEYVSSKNSLMDDHSMKSNPDSANGIQVSFAKTKFFVYGFNKRSEKICV